jgi:glycosyltransferase involved in cell wall biosynthesis
VSDYGVAPDRVIVSPNAVCEQLIPLRPAGCARAAPAPVPPQFRPLAGMIGVVSDRVRLDWAVDLLRRVPWLHLAIIGPVSRPLSAGTAASLAVLEGMRDRVVFCGAQPYESLTRFACACDVCLILLNEHGINPAASPTRFFSCLPAARPILASAGCPQLEEFSPLVRVFADPRALADAVVELRATGFDDGWNTDRWRAARQHTWSLRAELMLRRIGLLREAA